jgi:fibronectin-binding autotransporter adhesin
VSYGTGGGFIDVGAGATLTLPNASGTGGFSKIGAGTLVQTNPANNFTGDVNILEGTLQTGKLELRNVPSALGLSGASNVIRLGKFSVAGSTAGELLLAPVPNQTTNRSFDMQGAGGKITMTGGIVTFDLASFSGPGILTLRGTNPTDTFVFKTISGSRQTATYLDRVTVRITALPGLPDLAPVELVANTGASYVIDSPEIVGSLRGGSGPAFGKVILNSDLTVGGDNSNTAYYGLIEGAGKVTKAGTGLMVLTGQNTFSGTPIVSAGILAFTEIGPAGVPGPLGAGTEIQLGQLGGSDGATLRYDGWSSASTDRKLTLSASGGRMSVPDPGSSLVWSGVVNGPITAQFFKEGAGTLRLTGVNSFLGPVLVNAGKLQILGNNALPDFGAVTIASAGILELLAASNETVGSLAGSGTLILGGPRLTAGGSDVTTEFSGIITGSGQLGKTGLGTFTLSNSASTFTGGILISNGAVSVPQVANAGSSSPLGVNGGIILGDAMHTGRLIVTQSGNSATDRPFTISPGGGLIDVSAPGAELTISGSAAGNGSLTKLGAGRLRLLNDKTYTGATLVAEGVLQLEGSLLGDVTVIAPATLQSKGSPARSVGALSINGGTLSPGTPGAAANLLTGNLNLSGGAYAVDLLDSTPTGHDQLTVTGSVAFDGFVELQINLGFDPVDHVDVFTLVANDGNDPTTLSGSAARFFLPGLILEDRQQFFVQDGIFSQLFEIRYGLSPDDNDIELLAAPEPGTALLLLGGLTCLLGAPSRRTRGLE